LNRNYNKKKVRPLGLAQYPSPQYQYQWRNPDIKTIKTNQDTSKMWLVRSPNHRQGLAPPA